MIYLAHVTTRDCAATGTKTATHDAPWAHTEHTLHPHAQPSSGPSVLATQSGSIMLRVDCLAPPYFLCARLPRNEKNSYCQLLRQG